MWLAALVVATVATGAAQAEPGMFVGFSDDRPKWEGTRATAPAESLGARALRITVRWDGAQTEPTTTQTAELDQALAASGAFRTVLAFAGTPAAAPQTDPARDAYCTFARNVLARYSSVRDVVIWGEPNKSAFWQPQFNADGSSAAPAAYAALAARCWDVLHAANSAVNVLGPALSTNGNDVPGAASNVSHSPGNFIRKLGDAYRASGRTLPLFDTIAHHAYGATPSERPWRRHIGSKIIAQGDWNKLMYNLWLAFDGTAQPIPGECDGSRCTTIWYTEGGYETRVDDAKTSLYAGTEAIATIPDFAGGEPDSPPPADTTAAPDQATQVLDGIRLAYCQPSVGGFFNFLVWDEARLEGWQSGAYWADLTPKDSLPAFQQAIGDVNNGAVNCSALKGGLPSSDYFPPAAPPAPAVAVLLDPLRVTVTWSAPSDNVGVTSYRVYRNGGQVATTSDTTWTHTSPAEATTYTYAIRALDAAGNMGDASPSVSVTTPDVTAPSVPTNIVGRSMISPTRVELTWAASTDKVGVAGYHVYRDGVYLASTAATSLVDANVIDATAYAYSVSAYDAAGNVSAASPLATVTTAPAAPAAPTGSASTTGDGRITLDWADVAGATGYDVYRATIAGGPYEKRTASSLTASTFADTGTNGTTYYYAVTATGPGGESARSAEVAVRPTGDVVKSYAPSRYSINAGTVYSGRGDVGRLAADDSVWLELASSKWGYTYTADVSVVATIVEARSALKKLAVSYAGNASSIDASVTLMVLNATSGTWVTVDGPRAATTGDRSFGWSTATPADYVSGTGEVQFRIRATAAKAWFVARTDLVRFTVTS